MKQSLLFAALGLAACGVAAQEIGQVLSTTPVVQQVAVPRQVCAPTLVVGQPPTSGAGGLMGAIAGAAIGSTIGGGSGTAAAMLLGTVGGAIAGNSIEANGSRQAYAQPQCTTETSYENRTVGYNVTYEYAGRQYSTQLPYDPGPTIQLQVSPIGATTTNLPPAQAAGPVIAPPVAQAQAPVVVAQAPVVLPAPVVVQSYPAYPAYPVYAPYPVYRPAFPIGISLGFHHFSGHRHGHRHHGHRHRHHRRR